MATTVANVFLYSCKVPTKGNNSDKCIFCTVVKFLQKVTTVTNVFLYSCKVPTKGNNSDKCIFVQL